MTTTAPPDLDTDRAAVAVALSAIADRYLTNVPLRVADAVRYALAGEGKRLRALLCLAAYRAAGGRDDASWLAASIEIVHAYSLVHDDLPCMDDEDIRRGRPTLHKAFDVRTATAAGLAMVPLAAVAAHEATLQLGLAPEAASRTVRELMQASGASGMIGGQLLDLEGEDSRLTLDELEHIHRLKTGALIRAAVSMGGAAARADAMVLEALAAYGCAVGLAFQIADDVLDVTSTTDQLGKTAGRDAALRKSTHPVLLGVTGAVSRAGGLVDEACRTLHTAGLLTPSLEYLARFTVARRS